MHPFAAPVGTRLTKTGRCGWSQSGDAHMLQLFREFFWIIFPVLGMGIGAFAIWNEFSRQKKALEVLKVYAEKGQEPPESVLALLNRSSSPGGGARARNPWAQVVYFGVMAAGFGAVTFWFAQGPGWPFVLGFGIASFALAALAASTAVQALTTPRKNDQ